MIALLRMMRALFLRGWYTMLSYRFALYLRYVGVAFQLVLFYFTYQIFRDLQGGQMVHIAAAVNSNNYLDYAVTGGLAISLLSAATGSMMADIRAGQVMGTLETILASPMSVALLLAANWTYTFTRAFVGLGIALFIFVWLMDFKWENMNFLTMIVAFIAMVVAFTPLGILSTGFTLAFKRGDPVAMVMGALFAMFGGVVFPPSVLPTWLQPVADYVPLFYATTLIRESMLKAATIAQVSTELMVLFGFGLVLFPISLWVFTWGLNKARKDGSLSQY